MEIINYELKYCERCGTLKLRQVDAVSTYCRRCEGLLARFTFPRVSGDTNSPSLPSSAPGLPAGIPSVIVGDRLAGSVQ